MNDVDIFQYLDIAYKMNMLFVFAFHYTNPVTDYEYFRSAVSRASESWYHLGTATRQSIHMHDIWIQ